MRSFDVFNEQIGRIFFAKEKCNGNILDVTHGEYLSYYTSSILLNNSAEEVWSYDISEDDTYVSKRFLNVQKEIVIKNQGNPTKALQEKYFDCVISSETIQHSKNAQKEIDLYYSILKNDGKLIISTSNKNAPKKIKDIQNEKADINEFSKDEFIALLSKKFQNIELFSQRIIKDHEIQTSESLEKMRSREKIRNFFVKLIILIDPKQKIYTNFISKIKFSEFVNMDEKKYTKEEKPINQKYLPVKYKETDNPLFFILICYKMIN